ncbi:MULTISPECIES: hypothetical protein [Streptomyces]|uniref:hypothetical protein n=1 Tax=Streptomyces TaxID=1883 RepID=UPI000A51BCC4|nr:hypothetical protein [Streptomyces melanosporofaciens]
MPRHLTSPEPGAHVTAARPDVAVCVHDPLDDIRRPGDDAVRPYSESAALLGEVCGRAPRLDLARGHARTGDIRTGDARAAEYGKGTVPWNEEGGA